MSHSAESHSLWPSRDQDRGSEFSGVRVVGAKLGKLGVLGPQPYLPGGTMAAVQRVCGLVACVMLCIDTLPARGSQSRSLYAHESGPRNE